MALYLVPIDDGTALIRAANGNHACEIAEIDKGLAVRVLEAGPFGVLQLRGIIPAPARGADAPPAADDDEADDSEQWQEITNLGDKGVRRYKNRRTGEEKTEPR